MQWEDRGVMYAVKSVRASRESVSSLGQESNS